MSVVALIRKTGASTELGYDFDLANDGFVERSEVLSRNPVLQVIFPLCILDLIVIQKRLGDEKARDVSPAAGRHVPVTRYLSSPT